MPGWLWLVSILIGLLAFHLLMSWMESRGWVYWARSRGHSTRAGNAMLEIQQLLEPEKKNLIVVKQDSRPKRDATGEP